jgi:hypothetical protein
VSSAFGARFASLSLSSPPLSVQGAARRYAIGALWVGFGRGALLDPLHVLGEPVEQHIHQRGLTLQQGRAQAFGCCGMPH